MYVRVLELWELSLSEAERRGSEGQNLVERGGHTGTPRRPHLRTPNSFLDMPHLAAVCPSHKSCRCCPRPFGGFPLFIFFTLFLFAFTVGIALSRRLFAGTWSQIEKKKTKAKSYFSTTVLCVLPIKWTRDMFRALLFVGLCSPAVLSRVENQVQGATGAVSRATHGRQPGDTAAFTAISNGEQVSYPKPMYSEGAAQSYIPAGREGVKAKTKGCLHCMLFNSKQKVAKKYGDMYKKAMGRSIKKSRADAIGVQMQDQDIATMQERTGDKLYGSGGQSDIDRRRKDGEEKKCFDLPADKQEECLKRAKAMEPGVQSTFLSKNWCWCFATEARVFFTWDASSSCTAFRPHQRRNNSAAICQPAQH